MKRQLKIYTHANLRNINHNAFRRLVNSGVVGSAPLFDLRLIGFRPFFKRIGSDDAARNHRTDLGHISLELVSPEVRIKGAEQRISVILRQASDGQELRWTILQGESLP